MQIIIAEDPYLTQTYLRTNPGPTTLNAFTPQFLAAEKKCSALGFASGFVTTPAQIQQHVKREIAQVNCMRQHGFPTCPIRARKPLWDFPPALTRTRRCFGRPRSVGLPDERRDGRRNQRANRPDSAA